MSDPRVVPKWPLCRTSKLHVVSRMHVSSCGVMCCCICRFITIVLVAIDSFTFPPFTSKHCVAITKTNWFVLFGEVMPLYAAVWAYIKFLEFGFAVHSLLCGTVCIYHSCECYTVMWQLTFPAAAVANYSRATSAGVRNMQGSSSYTFLYDFIVSCFFRARSITTENDCEYL